MTTRFGYGFEKKSATSPSTQHAQAFFLGLLPQVNKAVAISLFEIANKPFVEFLTNHQEEIPLIKSRIEPTPFPMDTAIRIFIYSWSALAHQKAAERLCTALREWANRWNLTDEWCLNHAVLTLRDQSWDGALFWLKTEPIFSQAELTKELTSKGLSEFSFKYQDLNFMAEGPFFRSSAQFKHEVEQSFRALRGPSVRGARKALEYQRRSYLDGVAKIRKELNLQVTPVRWAEDHFKWLIHYQISCMTYRGIGREFRRDEKTVREGIQDVAKLMDLTLRSSEADKYLGRPKGAKDKKPRHRACAN